jgi:hypothetical protein
MAHRRAHPLTSFHYSLIVLAACAYAASADAASVIWNVDASGTWTTASNWSSPPSLPRPADGVTINQPDPLTVTLSSGTQSINSPTTNSTSNLTLSGGTLSLADALMINSEFVFSGATLTGSRSPTTNGLLTWSAGTLSVSTSANAGVNFSSESATRFGWKKRDCYVSEIQLNTSVREEPHAVRHAADW